MSSMIAWQTRVLASYTAGGYMIAKGEENEALSAAKLISFDDIERAQLEELSRAEKAVPPEENLKPGSYEKALGTFFGGRGFQR